VAHSERSPWPVPRRRKRAADREREGGRGRRGLSQDAIVGAALEIVDADGLDALSMRRVAQRLGTGPASLYVHLGGKEELLALVLDRVYGEVPLPEAPDPADWRAQAEGLLTAERDALAAHGDLARAARTGAALTLPNALRGTEALLAILRAGGLSGQDAAHAVDMLGEYVLSAALRTDPRGRPGGVYAERLLDRYRALRALPAAEYPNLSAVAEPLLSTAGDERFRFGLDVVLAGLAARARRPDGPDGQDRRSGPAD